MKRSALLLALAIVPLLASAATNINEPNAYSWGANVGFMNWRGDGANGVVFGRYILSGYIYGANIGWINVGTVHPITASSIRTPAPPTLA